jgi:hypothetical protein
MKARTLSIIFDIGIFTLLVVLILQAADIRRSLRRIEHEERRVVTQTRYPLGSPVLETAIGTYMHPYLGWSRGTGDWIMVPAGQCSNCQYGLFNHHFLSKEDCEKALVAWNEVLNNPPPPPPGTFRPDYAVGIIANAFHRLQHRARLYTVSFQVLWRCEWRIGAANGKLKVLFGNFLYD